MFKVMYEDIDVVGLSYYPIKSCAAIDAAEVTMTEFGIEYDREWMLVDSNGKPITQRVKPRLAVVAPNFEDGKLIVRAPGMGALAVSLEVDPDAEIILVNLWDKPGSGRSQGEDASAWFSQYLGKDVRLIRVEQPRAVKPECVVEGSVDHTAFADGFPLLVASMDSLEALNSSLAVPVPIDRFRPNIVVKGAEAYVEDYWREIKIGDMRAFIVRACARCPMPNIAQDVGIQTKERPVTDALRRSRRGTDPLSDGDKLKEFFAQNVVHIFEEGLRVRVGDKLEVVTRSDRRNWVEAA
jgi:uncharacterized protein